MWIKLCNFSILILFIATTSQAQQTFPLYDGAIPNSKNCVIKEFEEKSSGGRLLVKNVTVPTLTAFEPEQHHKESLAIIICPGGGYSNLSIGDGGMATAKELAKEGIYAFVLKYRLADSSCNLNSSIVPLQDLQQAIFVVRKNAEKLNIDPNRIGLLGFSAGGHLVTMAATHSDEPQIGHQAISLKPNFTILAYPVVSFMPELTAKNSKSSLNLLGKNPTQKQLEWFSGERNVSILTPPAFIVHASDDSTALVGNSLSYFTALQKYRIPSELIVYQKGGHGFANFNKLENDYWIPRAIKWLRLNDFME